MRTAKRESGLSMRVGFDGFRLGPGDVSLLVNGSVIRVFQLSWRTLRCRMQPMSASVISGSEPFCQVRASITTSAKQYFSHKSLFAPLAN